MTAITDSTGYKSLIDSPHLGLKKTWYKQNPNTSVSRTSSSWLSTPNPGATPSTAIALDNTVTGALDPTLTTAKQMFIAQMEAKAMASNVGQPPSRMCLLICDRLSHQGGLAANLNTVQTTNLPTAALTRYTSGVGVMPWLEVYNGVGSTATTFTISYTNQAGVSGQTSLATPIPFGITQTSAGGIYPIPLAQGDTGCQAVASVTLAASTGSAGNFGITLLKPLALVPPIEGGYNSSFWDALFNGCGILPEILTGACLMFIFINNSGMGNSTGYQVDATVIEN